MDMAEAGEDLDEISPADFGAMLEAGLNGLYGIVDAKVGDKTLVDTLAPAADVMKKAGETGQDFKEALEEMKRAAAAEILPKIWLQNLAAPAGWASGPEACWTQVQHHAVLF
jgi:hypothetical protein